MHVAKEQINKYGVMQSSVKLCIPEDAKIIFYLSNRSYLLNICVVVDYPVAFQKNFVLTRVYS